MPILTFDNEVGADADLFPALLQEKQNSAIANERKMVLIE